jgi:hypothetical protein
MFKNLEEAKKHYLTPCSLTNAISEKLAEKTGAADDISPIDFTDKDPLFTSSNRRFLNSCNEHILDSYISDACEAKKATWDAEAAPFVNHQGVRRACERHETKHRLLK